MKNLTSSTTATAIVIALPLFLVASWLDGRRPQSGPAAPPVEAPTLANTVRPDSRVRDDAIEQSCEAAEQDLMTRVAASQRCDVDADCTILDYGYPIQCLTSIARSEVSAVRLEYRNYELRCSYRVYYDCPSAPMERHPVCRNRRCAVELRTLDSLKDMTLDHIGGGIQRKILRPSGSNAQRGD